ncbi:hypothetical protein M0R45_019549 [Rubus argutus]|uniref:Uncharacterized protein n=1 Tax=Rubus argutus TaxID=59490 RepID=A0AAW1X842_RUBAR
MAGHRRQRGRLVLCDAAWNWDSRRRGLKAQAELLLSHDVCNEERTGRGKPTGSVMVVRLRGAATCIGSPARGGAVEDWAAELSATG